MTIGEPRGVGSGDPQNTTEQEKRTERYADMPVEKLKELIEASREGIAGMNQMYEERVQTVKDEWERVARLRTEDLEAMEVALAKRENGE